MEQPRVEIVLHTPKPEWLKKAAVDVIDAFNARYEGFKLRVGCAHLSDDEIAGLIAKRLAE